MLVVFWHHFLTCFCNWSHLWFSWFLTTLPIENSFFPGLMASLLTHFVIIFSTSFQVSFLTWFFSTFEAISVSILSQQMEKNSSWKSLVFWLRKKSRRNCFLHFRRLFGVISASLLLDFRVPFFTVFFGVGAGSVPAPVGSLLELFWCHFYVFLLFFCMQFKFVWPWADSWSQSDKKRKCGNSV